MNLIYKLNLRERVIIGGLILILVGFFLYSLIIAPQLLNLKAVRKQLLIQSRFLQSKKERINQLLILKQKYNALQKRAGESNQRFFVDDEAVSFLKSLNNLVEQETRNNLVLIKPLSEKIISESPLGRTRMRYKISDVQIVN